MNLMEHIDRPPHPKAAAILDQILPAFEDAVAFAEQAKWTDEVEALNAAFEIAKSISTFRGPAVFQSARSDLLKAGLIFRGAEPVGDIFPLTGDQLMLQKQSIFAGLTHQSDKIISVWTDRIICGNEVRPIDESTTANVFLDGSEQVVQRPTLTRMLLLSPLPGTALVPGMALQKKSKVDTREVTFAVASAGWQFNCRTSPDLLTQSKVIAERINAIASSLEKTTPSSPVAKDKVQKIKELKDLLDDGAITPDEYNDLKTQILSAD